MRHRRTVEDLKKILKSIHDTVSAVGAQVVTGDTKVVNRGSAEGEALVEPLPDLSAG